MDAGAVPPPNVSIELVVVRVKGAEDLVRDHGPGAAVLCLAVDGEGTRLELPRGVADQLPVGTRLAVVVVNVRPPHQVADGLSAVAG